MKTAEEKKQEPEVVNPLAGGNDQGSEPNQGQPGVEFQAKIKELEDKLKNQDSQIADLTTTKATLEARFSQVNQPTQTNTNAAPVQPGSDLQVMQRAKRILENSAYNPDDAAKELTGLLSEVQSQAARTAVLEAQRAIRSENTIEKLRSGIKVAHPDLQDDDIVDVIMDRANQLAATGKFKTPDEAVAEAAKYIKNKFDSYATKSKAVPPLPPGAAAETGSNPSPAPKQEEKIPEGPEILEERYAAQSKKIL